MQPYFDQLATAFEAANPGIKVEVEVVNWNDIDQKVKTLVQTGQLPDIANLNYFAELRGGRPALHGRPDRHA